MKRPSGQDAGFSLLETLLGLTLTAMIAAVMMGSMQMGNRVWERERSSEHPGATQLLIGQAGEWLAQAMPTKLHDIEEPILAPFRGEARAVSFQYAAPALGGSPGVYMIDFELVEAPGCTGGMDLYMQSTRMEPTEEGAEPVPLKPERRRLMTCIAGPSFIFWDALAGAEESGWRADWIDQATLPGVVRLRSIGADGVERGVLTQRLMYAQR